MCVAVYKMSVPVYKIDSAHWRWQNRSRICGKENNYSSILFLHMLS